MAKKAKPAAKAAPAKKTAAPATKAPAKKRVIFTLAPGEYEYKFVINGTWCVDPNCKEWRQNTLGTLNSVLRV